MRICPKCGEDDKTWLASRHVYACGFCGNRWEDGINPPEPTYARGLVLKGDPVVLRGSREDLERLHLAVALALKAGGPASCGNVTVELSPAPWPGRATETAPRRAAEGPRKASLALDGRR